MILAADPGIPLSVVFSQFSAELELEISHRFAQCFTFSVVRVDNPEVRLRLEAGLIASLAAGPKPAPSADWLGHHSPVAAIRESGLWNRNHVHGPRLSAADFELLRQQV